MHSEQPASSAFSPVGAPQLGQVSNLPEINLFSQLAPFYAPGQQGQPGGITAQQLHLWQLQHLQTVCENLLRPRALSQFETCRDRLPLDLPGLPWARLAASGTAASLEKRVCCPQMSQQAAQPAATTKSDSKSSSAYASRHQAAEQRRRNRINER